MAHIEPGPAWYITGIDGEDKKKEEPKGDSQVNILSDRNFSKTKMNEKFELCAHFHF